MKLDLQFLTGILKTRLGGLLLAIHYSLFSFMLYRHELKVFTITLTEV